MFGACGCVEEIPGKLIWCIVLEEGKGIPDEVKLKVEIPKQGEFSYKSKVLKYWRYDIEMLYNENMYLLYPLQIFKLRESMKEISRSRKSREDENHPDHKNIKKWAEEQLYREYDKDWTNIMLKHIKYKKTEWDKINQHE